MIKTFMATALLFAALIALSVVPGVTVPAQAADQCHWADQCHGPLPQLCKRCRGGHNGCAHWACVHDRCVIRYCG